MKIILLWAMDEKGGIGCNNKLPWYYPEDLKQFRKKTLHCPVVMGRKTFESLPSGPLKERLNLVLSHTLEVVGQNVISFKSIKELLERGIQEKWPVLYVIGGADIYSQFLPQADVLEVTRIGKIFPCDRYFPSVNWSEWRQIARQEEGELTFERYERAIRIR
jgi:dihydrofolate reductase